LLLIWLLNSTCSPIRGLKNTSLYESCGGPFHLFAFTLFFGFCPKFVCVISFHYLHLFFLLLLSFAEKSTLNTAVSQFCSGFTEVVGIFLMLPCWTHIIATRILITCLANDIKLLTRLLINCLTHNLPHTHNK
jgi:hypothetical protein